MGIHGYTRHRENDPHIDHLNDELETTFKSIIDIEILDGVLLESVALKAIPKASKARINSLSTNVFTLVTSGDTANFNVGKLVRCTASSAGALVRPGIMKVSAIGSGTVTVEDAAPTLVANDYLYLIHPNTIKHPLGRRPRGFIVVKQNNWGSIWGSVFTDTRLTLYAENDVTANLWVF